MAAKGSLDEPLPMYTFDAIRAFALQEHPDVLTARIGVRRAETALQRERMERIPNVTVAAGYTRDNIGKQDEWTFQVGMPVPLFNRNQGNIQAAHAEVGQAALEISHAENTLTHRLATAIGEYASARERVGRYRATIRPIAERTYKLSVEAFKGGQFEYLRVLQAQPSLAEANLEYNRALLEGWRAASELAGMMLEEDWPCQQPNDATAWRHSCRRRARSAANEKPKGSSLGAGKVAWAVTPGQIHYRTRAPARCAVVGAPVRLARLLCTRHDSYKTPRC